MSKDWRAYAEHVLESAAKLERIRARGDLAADDILYDAALRNLQTLAEATQRLPDALKAKYPEIDWKNIAAFRNILVHNYLGEIDAVTVLRILQNNVPSLAAAVTEMLDV